MTVPPNGATSRELDLDSSTVCGRIQQPVCDNQTPSLFEGAPVGSAHLLISDVGSHKMANAQNPLTYEPNTYIISNRLANIGIAFPVGIAADLATDPNVVVATRDGGFLMNAAGIETATRLGLGYTIVVFNDDGYGLLSENQITPPANTSEQS